MKIYFEEGLDVTDLLKITQIEDEVPATRSISKEQKEKQFKAKHKKFFSNPIVSTACIPLAIVSASYFLVILSISLTKS